MAPFAFALIDENKHLRFPRVIAKLADELVLMRQGRASVSCMFYIALFRTSPVLLSGLPERLFPERLRSAGSCQS